MIRIEINDEAVAAALARLSAGLGDLSDPMNNIGAALVRSTKDRISKGITSEGAPFAPRSKVTLARYDRLGLPYKGPLHQTGDMAGDIAHEYGADYTMVGSNAIQAAVMQFGAKQGAFGAFIGKDRKGRDHFHTIPWGDIPARPFLGVSDEDRGTIVEIVEEWLEDLAGD